MDRKEFTSKEVYKIAAENLRDLSEKLTRDEKVGGADMVLALTVQLYLILSYETKDTKDLDVVREALDLTKSQVLDMLVQKGWN